MIEAKRDRLTLAERRLVYGAARDCYLRRQNDIEQCKVDFQNHTDIVGFSQILIELAIQLAVALFRWWLDNRLSVPCVIPSASDPGFFDVDEVEE